MESRKKRKKSKQVKRPQSNLVMPTQLINAMHIVDNAVFRQLRATCAPGSSAHRPIGSGLLHRHSAGKYIF